MLNEIRTIPILDVDNDRVKISVIPLPAFITINQYNFTIKPKLIESVGIYPIKLKLQDTFAHFSEYNLRIEVSNTPPTFANSLPQDQSLYLNELLFCTLPSFKNDENRSISVIPESIPPFAALVDNRHFLFSPVSVLDIGTHLILFHLTHNYTSDSFTRYSFQVTVLNSPPFFKPILENLRVQVGSIITYRLPEIIDRENLKVQVYIGQLPKFMSVSD